MIKLSRMADYGVVLMSELARAPETLRTAAELAQGCGLAPPTAAKLLKQLAQEGLAASHRGTKGGYVLARAAEDISMADIIGAVEGPIALTECVGEDETGCEIEALCPTRTNWQKINDAIIEALAGISLAEMIAPPVDFRALFPQPDAAPPGPAAAD